MDLVVIVVIVPLVSLVIVVIVPLVSLVILEIRHPVSLDSVQLHRVFQVSLAILDKMVF